MKYLLAISIGPVQDFIAIARRSRDLWFGSWLLSEVSKAAAKKINEAGAVLVFPAPANPATDLAEDSEYSVVNKLLAQIETDNIHAFCDSVSLAASERLRRISIDAFKDLKTLRVSGRSAIWRDRAEAQLNDLIEFFWAAYPFEDSNYEISRKNAEALLAARKVTRNFKAISWGDNVPKSSLDGLRESVIDEAVYDQLDGGDLATARQAELLKLRTKLGVRGKERLCGVGLLKRHGKPKKGSQDIDSFFSTSHVAALPLLNRLKDKGPVRDYLSDLTRPDLLDIIDDKEIRVHLGHVRSAATLRPHEYFCNDAGTLLYDGHLLFKERLRDFFPDRDKRETAESALNKFLKAAFESTGEASPTPHPYYAILHADGDRMGAVIDAQAKEGIETHIKLSQALSSFAADVKGIVEIDHQGSCIYAGGDDVLALLPLHTVLPCARELADKFQQALQEFSDGNTPTLSVGIAIGHHLDPLQDTLSLARDAEKIAKKEVPNKHAPEKNALAVTLSKRSGADRTVKGSWDRAKPEGALDARLNGFVFLLLKDELPDSAAFELRDLALRLKPPKDATTEEQETFLAAQKGQAKLILKRKQPKHGLEERPADKVLVQFCGLKPKNGSDEKPGYLDQVDLDNWTLGNLADELILARELATAIEQAGTEHHFATTNGFIEAGGEPTNGDK
jgi:CRISPR-associated protein Cmr2